jgi:Flavin-binding monooxygenase-like
VLPSVCVIGAGPSGLPAIKNLVDAGLDVVAYERGREVGGNWVFDPEPGHSSVFETTHIISSRRYSEYEDFPWPPGTADYPGHAQLAGYFRGYAERFGLHTYIRFRTLVISAVPAEEGGFWVTTRSEVDGTEERVHFDKLVVANGHHWKPRWPEYPGTFTGRMMHSHDFKRAAPFAGQRVLVIGGGNSACDVAVETSRVSARTDLSWRRGYRIVPKFLFGQPVDHLDHLARRYLRFVPRALRMAGHQRLLDLMNGPNRLYGLPEPDHAFGSTHPTLNSELLYSIRHGDVHPRPDIARYDGSRVHFRDGTVEEYDAIIACTGYTIAHPFFDRAFIDYSEGPVPLYLRMIHPTLDDLVFIGLFQPLGCIWPGAELQSKLVARWWTGRWSPPKDRQAAIARELAHPDLPQVDSPRHTITVDEPTFRSRLQRELGR